MSGKILLAISKVDSVSYDLIIAGDVECQVSQFPVGVLETLWFS